MLMVFLSKWCFRIQYSRKSMVQEHLWLIRLRPFVGLTLVKLDLKFYPPRPEKMDKQQNLHNIQAETKIFVNLNFRQDENKNLWAFIFILFLNAGSTCFHGYQFSYMLYQYFICTKFFPNIFSVIEHLWCLQSSPRFGGLQGDPRPEF